MPSASTGLAPWARSSSASGPYVVFADATLEAVAHKRPKTRKALLALPGLGPVKAERYGEKLLEMVKAHAET